MKSILRKWLGWKQIGVLAYLGVSVLLSLGFGFQVISPRVWGVSILLWFVGLMVWGALAKSAAQKRPASDAEVVSSLDDRTFRRFRQWIWIAKVWIGILIICLPLGIANGLVQHMLVPTFIGVGINLLMMYVAVRQIRRMRKLIGLSTQQSRDIQ
jgi:hypothetical protein